MSFSASPNASNFPYGFANGVTMRNMPILQTQGGQVFWVYNGTALPPTGKPGSNGNRGTFDAPFLTIAGAQAACVANRGDIIMVKPGHAETLTLLNTLTLSVAGIQVIGLGAGFNRPQITIAGATTATLNVTGANITLQNFTLSAITLDAINAMVTVSGADFGLRGCFVRLGDATNQATLGISTTATAVRLSILGNYFGAAAVAGTTAAIQLVGGSEAVIADNILMGAYGGAVGAISNITTVASDLHILRNVIGNSTAGSTKSITAVAGTTGFISDNRMQILSGTAPITAAGMSWVGANYYAAAVATTGTLV